MGDLKVGNMIPMLNVVDIDKSFDFYRVALGFELVSSSEVLTSMRWGIIACDDTEFMLSESMKAPQMPRMNPLKNINWAVNFYFYPSDIQSLHKHLEALDFRPSELTVTDYGMQEFSLQDPDGHILSFGSELT